MLFSGVFWQPPCDLSHTSVMRCRHSSRSASAWPYSLGGYCPTPSHRPYCAAGTFNLPGHGAVALWPECWRLSRGAAGGDRLLEVAVRPVGLLLATPLTSAIREHAQDALTDEDVQFAVRAARALVEDLKMHQPQASPLPADPQSSWRAKRVLGSCPSAASDPPRRPRARVRMSPPVVRCMVASSRRHGRITRARGCGRKSTPAPAARTTGQAYPISPLLSESLSSPTALLCFVEIQGLLRPFAPTVIRPVEKSVPPPRAGTAGARDSSLSGSSAALGTRPWRARQSHASPHARAAHG
jgi:hypothetical protein